MTDHGKSAGKSQGQGQAKTHEVVAPDGTRSTMSQQEWRDRDKSLGLERVDEDETPEVPAVDDSTGTPV